MDISISMNRFMKDHSRLKYIFFGGKGGVGKTAMAGAAALWSARHGRKTLLVSTNPIHGLSNLLDQDVSGKPTPVAGESDFHALEIDTREAMERSKQDMRNNVQWFLSAAGITTNAEEFIGCAALNPVFEESAMFENVLDIVFKDEYECYVFDTAPAADAGRLFRMPWVYSLWIEKMLSNRGEAEALREKLSFTKKKERRDPLLEYLQRFKERMDRAKAFLTDEALTAFFLVTRPEGLSVAVAERFAGWVRKLGIPAGGVVVNGIIPRDEAGADTLEFMSSRIRVQDEQMAEIGRVFGDGVRAATPLFETGVKGTGMLARTMAELFPPNAA